MEPFSNDIVSPIARIITFWRNTISHDIVLHDGSCRNIRHVLFFSLAPPTPCRGALRPALQSQPLWPIHGRRCCSRGARCLHGARHRMLVRQRPKSRRRFLRNLLSAPVVARPLPSAVTTTARAVTDDIGELTLQDYRRSLEWNFNIQSAILMHLSGGLKMSMKVTNVTGHHQRPWTRRRYCQTYAMSTRATWMTLNAFSSRHLASTKP